MQIYTSGKEEMGINYLASYNTYPEAVFQKAGPSEILDDTVQGMLTQGAELIHTKNITFSGIPGLDVRMNVLNGMMTIRTKFFIKDRFLYQLLFYGPTYIADHDSIDAFLDSFVLLHD